MLVQMAELVAISLQELLELMQQTEVPLGEAEVVESIMEHQALLEQAGTAALVEQAPAEPHCSRVLVEPQAAQVVGMEILQRQVSRMVELVEAAEGLETTLA